MKFSVLYDKTVKPEQRFVGRLLAIDPGETTGYSVFECTKEDNPKLVTYGQLASAPIDQGIDLLTQTIMEVNPTKIVYEDYRVYSWKTQDHTWAALHTPQLIGVIQTLARQHRLSTYKQMAQHAKQFFTNEKLEEWGYYCRGKRHATDSIRHALLYLVFNHIKTLQAS